jgi:hypothetical protein
LVKIAPTTNAVTWKYEGESEYSASAFSPDFGYVPPNVTVTVNGASSSRFVELYRCQQGTDSNCANGTWVLQATTTTSNASSSWTAKFSVTAEGNYRVIVVRKSFDTGNLSNATGFFTYQNSQPVNTAVSVSAS